MDADRENRWVHARGDAPVDRWRDYHRPTLRDRLRHAALDACCAVETLTGSADRDLRLPGVQFLLLHHLFDDEVESFSRLLRRLAQTHRFLGYGEAIESLRAGRVDAPAVTFSFDDGRASCAAAARILAEHGARACFFVCPGIVGETRPARLRSFCHERLHYPVTPFLDWDGLESLRSMGHEVGNHTQGHVNLARCDAAEHEEEIAGAAETLRRRLGICEHFAWPYGGIANISPEAVAAIWRSGHRSIASALRGRHAGALAPRACLRRDNVVAAWPVRHTLHFIAANARRQRSAGCRHDGQASGWPEGWDEIIEGRCASPS
ncbi:MAG TPA: polysaccharide deacetylase family protein [Phycisphaerales bacterium]|nr:polysaccharide deacetylase family protein [Phycisphaerales bacterium]HMP38550.1 polysaccharide deacetylase family protein [Phycisphaerales bacterium]